MVIFFQGASKDYDTGIACLRELIDPARDPLGDGVALLTRLYPGIEKLYLSGDTGK